MVAIKDMEMPSSCYECDLHNYHKCDLTNDDIEKYLDDGKHPSCPLVEIGTCKDCKNWNEHEDNKSIGICDELSSTRDIHYTTERFYCADFEKRGAENV